MTTPKAVSAVREGMKLNQREFAEHIGTTVETISRWERGHREPTRQALERLSVVAQEAGLKHLADFFFRSAQATIINRVKGLKSSGSERHISIKELKYWSAYLHQTWRGINDTLASRVTTADQLRESLRNVAGVMDHIRDKIELYIDEPPSSDRAREDEEILKWGHRNRP